ncbi:MAG TPA: bifunctional tetrahydrofolate synthase/dihydrofolate synthase [Steroidobacteraceae bacterium]|nr:bifunctional tetrahydrofolate synthase/dihydrofolate synthase [Steroidobacteraceae bacterium]
MSARAGSLAEALAYQQSAHGPTIDLGLERVREVGARLGLLDKHCPVAIVGGTNGKGSTACTLAALLAACGHRVGLFTSPHLVRYNERVQINGTPVDDATLLRAFEFIEAARESITLTFFEYNTLAALEIFRHAGVSSLVLEVGLGGRLDATNIIDADVAMLCSVGMDHREWLGDTLEQIGAEKAGIFRRGQPVVLGNADMPASVWQHAAALQCRLYTAGREFSVRVDAGSDAGGRWDYASELCSIDGLPAPALEGEVQYHNAAAALTALNLLGVRGACELPRIVQGLRAVHLPGRFQRVPGDVEWILDVAHNEPAATVLAAALQARPAAGRTYAVLGMLADKDVTAVARALDAVVDYWVLAGLDEEPRGLSAEALQARLPRLRGSIERGGHVPDACARARTLARTRDRVVVLGSFHVVGPALVWLGLY